MLCGTNWWKPTVLMFSSNNYNYNLMYKSSFNLDSKYVVNYIVNVVLHNNIFIYKTFEKKNNTLIKSFTLNRR